MKKKKEKVYKSFEEFVEAMKEKLPYKIKEKEDIIIKITTKPIDEDDKRDIG